MLAKVGLDEANARAKPTVVLCNLVPGGLVLVEVMFPVKPADRLNLAVQGDCGAEGRKESGSLKLRLATWECQIEQSDIGVRGSTRGCGRSC